MRNLKRVLSLALALTMALSLLVVSSSAAEAKFSDQADITYAEAVDTMAALKVLEGSNGAFNPQGQLTREAGAKIVAYMLLGKDNADKLAGSGAFTDVAATRWSAGYIDYCASLGILAGNGDGTFAPEGPLTGLAFGKMLLVALGYDAAIESYTGANWATMIAADMIDAKIDVKGVNLAGVLTREQAAQMAFQALTANMVKYTDKGTDIQLSDGTSIKVGASPATTITNTKADDYRYINAENENGADTIQQFCEKYFADLSKTAAKGDDFGRPAATWYNGTKKIGTYANSTPVLTYTTKVSPNKIYNDLGLEETTTAKMWVDGYQHDTDTKLTISKADTVKYIGGEGIVTEIYKVDNAYVAVQVANYLAKVTKVTDYKAATDTKDEVKASIDLEVYGTDYGTVDFEKFETTGFAKGDYVVVTLVNAHDGDKITVKSAAKAASFDGVMSKYSATDVTVDGTASKVGAKYAGVAPASIGFKDTYTYYTDANGVVLFSKLKDAAVSTDYAYVVKVQEKTTDDLVSGASNIVKAEVIFTDGTHEIIDLKVTKDAGKYYFDEAAANGTVTKKQEVGDSDPLTTPIGNWFAYTKNTDGTYTLAAVNADYGKVVSGATIVKDKTTQIATGYYTNTATVVTAIDSDYKVTSFTGYPSAQKSLTGNVLYTYAKDSKVVAAVYAYNNTVTGADKTYAYAVKAGATTENGTEWTFAIDGAQVTYVIEKETTMPEAGYVYTVKESTNKAGTYNVEGKTDLGAGTKVTVVDASFIAAGGIYELTATTVVYNVDADLEEAELGSKDTVEKDDYVYVFETELNSGKAKVVYIVAEAE